MYGKIFATMYKGTLRANWQALVTFQQMIVLADREGFLDMTAEHLAAHTGIPLKIISVGIKFLESPDPFSKSTDCDGRRIERLDTHRPWGWRIVNYEKYRDMRSDEDRREYMRKYMQNRRSTDKSKTEMLTSVNTCKLPLAYAEAEVKEEVDKNVLASSLRSNSIRQSSSLNSETDELKNSLENEKKIRKKTAQLVGKKRIRESAKISRSE